MVEKTIQEYGQGDGLKETIVEGKGGEDDFTATLIAAMEKVIEAQQLLETSVKALVDVVEKATRFGAEVDAISWF